MGLLPGSGGQGLQGSLCLRDLQALWGEKLGQGLSWEKPFKGQPGPGVG